MEYEIFSFLIVLLLVFFLKVMMRWGRWPFSLRALYWCGAFSYVALVALPRIFVIFGADTMIQIVFWIAIAILFAWILAYHNI
jgi:hypothetical protein